jgi:D-alanyl-D-alanine carboxypeptidase
MKQIKKGIHTMKTKHLLINVLLLAALLLAGCGAKETAPLTVPEGAQAGDPTGLKDCEFQTEGSRTKYAAECGALTALLDEQVAKQDILGMVMAVRLPDGTVIWDTAGYTSPSGNEHWTANTASPIGSVTKTFTAVVVMQLVEEGKLSLDDTVDTWFPEQPNGDKITVRMLLSHTSGLAVFSSTWGTDLDKWSRDWTPEELIAEANKAGTLGKPGSSIAHYSNTW